MRLWTQQALRSLAVQTHQEEFKSISEELKDYYRIDLTKLTHSLRTKYTKLDCDGETKEFLQKGTEPLWRHLTASFLSFFWSMTDVNAILDRGNMFLLSSSHIHHLITPYLQHVDNLHMLDIGAGSGHVTEKLARNLGAKTVVATDASKRMAATLTAKGFHGIDDCTLSSYTVKQYAQYHLISLLNVLDRCDFPMSLLKRSSELLTEDGILLLAIVMPFDDMVEDGWTTRAPKVPLPLDGYRCRDEALPENSLCTFVERILYPLNLSIISLSAVPYLCEGDAYTRFFALRNYILIVKKKCHSMIPTTNPMNGEAMGAIFNPEHFTHNF